MLPMLTEYTYTTISRSRTLNDQFRKWGVPKGTCSLPKNRVPAATPYTNLACHPGDTWYAVERPLPPAMMPLNPYLSSQGPNLDTVGITNSANSAFIGPINQHTQDVTQTKFSSSVNAEKPYVSTMLRLGSGPAEWKGSFVDYPGGTSNPLPNGTERCDPEF